MPGWPSPPTIEGRQNTPIFVTYLNDLDHPALQDELSAAGGSGTIAVTAPTDCNWAANALGAFIAITGGAGGTGNGTVSYTVAPNSSTVGRSGEIGIAEPGSTTRKSFTVTQAGTP